MHKQTKLAEVLNEGEGNLKCTVEEGKEYLLCPLGQAIAAETLACSTNPPAETCFAVV